MPPEDSIEVYCHYCGQIREVAVHGSSNIVPKTMVTGIQFLRLFFSGFARCTTCDRVVFSVSGSAELEREIGRDLSAVEALDKLELIADRLDQFGEGDCSTSRDIREIIYRVPLTREKPEE